MSEMDRWIEEHLHKHWHAKLKVDRVIHEVHTDLQDLVIFENGDFGRVLMLDKIIQLTSKDEFVYHEMMAHVPLFAMQDPKSVLIVGGGDGGVLREALRHPSIQNAVLCEIDPSVIDLCRNYFPEVSNGAFDNPRTKVVIADGAKFVAETDSRFDAILVDSTDPIGPGKVLFSEQFYRNCKRCLNHGGVLVTQQGLPFLQPWEIKESVQLFRTFFRDATAYLPVTASYLGGHFALGWASDDPSLRNVRVPTLRERFARLSGETNYYTPEMHSAAFVHPSYVLRLLGTDK
jgi:spermidine synthase